MFSINIYPLILVCVVVVPPAASQLKFRQWWKAVKNTPSCVRYIQQYSWTWLPSKNEACAGAKCDFPKEICMSFSADASEQKCQKVLPACYKDAAVYFCPGRHQEFKECGPANPKSCETPSPPSGNGTCVSGCFCRDPWILVRSQRSVCVRKDHCDYFVEGAGQSPAPWERLSSPLSSRGLGRAPRLPSLGRGKSSRVGPAWKESSPTSGPLFPSSHGDQTAGAKLGKKCVYGGTEYPLGAEMTERERSGVGPRWPYKIIRACATNAVGEPTWAAIGCLDHAQRRVRLGQTFLDPTTDFLMKCEGKKDEPETISVRVTSCVYQNDTFFPNGSSWTVANIVRKCSLSSGGPGSRILGMGCVDDFGDGVPAGAEFRTKDGLHMRTCLAPSAGEDWRTAIVACVDSAQNRRRCDQDYSIYARLKLAGYAKKLCRLCRSSSPPSSAASTSGRSRTRSGSGSEAKRIRASSTRRRGGQRRTERST